MKVFVPIKSVPNLGPHIALASSGESLCAWADRFEQQTNPFDEYALEAALRLTENGTNKAREGEVVVVAVGGPSVTGVLRSALAVGADRAVCVTSPDPNAWASPERVAHALSAVVREQAPDLVLMGKQASDTESFAVGPFLAEYLGWPLVTLAVDIELEKESGSLRLERESDEGLVTVRVHTGAVVTVSDRIMRPGAVRNLITPHEFRYPESDNIRYASLKGVLAAKKKPVIEVRREDLGEPPPVRARYVHVEPAPERARKKVIVESPAELVQRLREDGVLLAESTGLQSSARWGRNVRAPDDAGLDAPLADDRPSAKNAALVVVDAGSHARGATLAAIGAGDALREFAEMPYEVLALGAEADSALGELRCLGARRVLSAPLDPASVFLSAVDLVTQVAQKEGYGALLSAATSFGRELMPRVAHRLGASLITEVIRFERFEATARAVRPLYAGRAVATVESLARLCTITVRPSAFSPPPQSLDRSPVARVDASETTVSNRLEWLSLEARPAERPHLARARRIVAGGRGLRDASTFHALIDPLAEVLGAAVGGSRAACDFGALEADLQIGQTGQTICPDLYVAVGISGALQHVAGVRNAKTIVAINKDANAPLVGMADYVLLGDLFVLVPALTAALRA